MSATGWPARGRYNRVLLSHVLAGTAHARHIALAGPDWYAHHRVTLHAGVRAVRIDRQPRVVTTDDARTVPYGTLVLATGSAAVLPPIAGLAGTDGSLRSPVAVFRTLDDCAGIIDHARNALGDSRIVQTVVKRGYRLAYEPERSYQAAGEHQAAVAH